MDGQQIFNKGAKYTQWGKTVSQQMVLGKLNNHIQKTEVRPYLTLDVKFNSNGSEI